MSLIDLFEAGEYHKNLNHFAAIVNLAAVDGEINNKEEAKLKHFASKLEIGEEEYLKVLKNPTALPIYLINSVITRLEKLYDLFQIIFADHYIDVEEEGLISKYAIGLGFSPNASETIIRRSIKIFSGQIDFDDYLYLLNKG